MTPAVADEMALAAAVVLGLGLALALVATGMAEHNGLTGRARGVMWAAGILVLAGMQGIFTVCEVWWALPVLCGSVIVTVALLLGLYRLGLWLGKDC